MSSLEDRVRRVKWRVQSVKCTVRSAECEVPSAKREAQRCREGRCGQCDHADAVADSVLVGFESTAKL